MSKRVIVLDTSAFIAGIDPNSITEPQYSVPAVKNELSLKSLPWFRFNTAVQDRKLIIRMPGARFLREVKKRAKSVGDFRYLSEVDLHVLALALDLKNANLNPVIVTDDYSIQNVANKLDVDFMSLLTYGIKFRLNWILYCPACYRKYPPDCALISCRICGTKIKRKPVKKTRL